RLARQVVLGRPEAAGDDEDVGALDVVDQLVDEVALRVADDALPHQRHGVVLERGGDLQRVRVEARRPEHLRADGDDGGVHPARLTRERGRRPTGMRRTILLLALLALTTGAAWRRGDAYVLHAGKTNVTMTSVSIRELPALLRRLGDTPYLWVRLGSREWLRSEEGRGGEGVWCVS